MPHKNHTHHRAVNAKRGDDENKFTFRLKHNKKGEDISGAGGANSTVAAALKFSASASKDFNVQLKHVRREFEPSEKTAGDHMLAVTWREMPAGSLSEHALFALHEVLHLSHATHVQQEVIPFFSQNANRAPPPLPPQSTASAASVTKDKASKDGGDDDEDDDAFFGSNDDDDDDDAVAPENRGRRRVFGAVLDPTVPPPARSVVVESRTGSGKTLAFVVPVVERLLRQNERHVARTGRPYLARQICSVIVSPSRVLAQQTFIVGRNYACRYPFALRFMLVDRHVEALEKTAARLLKVARCGGIIAVGTVADVGALGDMLIGMEANGAAAMQLLAGIDVSDDDEVDGDDASGGKKLNVPTTTTQKQKAAAAAAAASSSSDEYDEDEDDGLDPEERKRRIAILKQRAAAAKAKRQGGGGSGGAPSAAAVDMSSLPQFGPFNNGANGERFLCVVDEADVVLRDPASFAKLVAICDRIKNKFGAPSSSAAAAAAPKPAAKGSSKGNGSKAAVATSAPSSSSGLTDFGLFGATATSAKEVGRFVHELVDVRGIAAGTHVETITLSALDTDVGDLHNLYELCKPRDMLQSLVHALNSHPNKKHFVFFNHVAVLAFVHRVLVALSAKGGHRFPVLRTSSIYVLHEGMKDAARFEHFGKFVRHGAATSTLASNNNSNSSNAAGAAAEGAGAILLCTDEAAFGLDVRDVDYVVHFEAPTSLQRFTHRSGRVARMGMRGTSLMLLPDNERARRFVAAVSARFALQPLHQHQHHTVATAVAAAEAAAAEAQGANPSKNTTHASAVVAAGSYATYGAPITAAIHAYVEDIASGAAEVELRQAAATTAQFLHLPARRSRTCEEKLAHAPQQQAIASAAAVIHVGAGSGSGGNGAGSGSAAVSAINAVAHASFDSLSGPKMLAAAVAAMTSNFVGGGDDSDSAAGRSTAERDDDDDRSLFSAEEAVCALTARAMN